MATKQISARITQKHDTEERWNLAVDFVPLSGEIIIYDIDPTHNYERIKIGNGTATVTELPFVNIQALLEHNTDQMAHSDLRQIVEGKQDKGNYALKSEIPTELPANGGNSDTVNNLKIVVSNVPPTVDDKSIITIVVV